MQDKESGRRGAEFGRRAAERAAAVLGVKLAQRSEGNQVTVNGETSVIKSAHAKTHDIGITKRMLPHLDGAFAVLEDDANRFSIFKLSKKYLQDKRREPGSRSKQYQWFYRVSDIRRSCPIVDKFTLRESRNYWVTTQWPHREDTDPDAPRYGVYLPDGREEAGRDMRPGDLVAVYESKRGRPALRVDVDGGKSIVKTHVGREGIVALLGVTSKLCSDPDSEPERYSDGTRIWWRWYAETEPHLTSGFLPRKGLNEILGYKAGNVLRGFGDLHSGLLRIDRADFEAIEGAFKEHGVMPELKRVVARSSTKTYGGGGGESPEHESIKRAVAGNPAGVLGEAGLRTVKMEYAFPTNDRADVILEDAQGRIVGVEVEPKVGDEDLPGILQAIKYRHMAALMFNKIYPDSRSFLVAAEISVLARKICKRYQVECFVVLPSNIGTQKGQ